MCRDVYGMWKFVMYMHRLRYVEWLESSDWSQGSPRACFGCFRVRQKEQFSPQQYHLGGRARKFTKGEYWRRRCWECLRRFYHPQLADAEARARFHRQVLCGVCNCLRYVDEDCRGCVVRSARIAECRRLKELSAKKRRPGFDWMKRANVMVPSWLDEEATTAEEPDEAEVTEPDKAAMTRGIYFLLGSPWG
ncbi:hypothetical protein F5144DRAFT_585584 [Chaetomium tenue]|uniref:Uncharacterized protein n=1 Tax=Chaetomium tenue TaxID=1854479 RepID=A0ACB7NY59_9PEZI|nr:hypothetical protein F5144DRAFT_585584 [Chaetomium globosum]